MEPKELSMEFLKKVTNGFSEKIGESSFGVFYKGMLENGQQIAVQKLRDSSVLHSREFHNQVQILSMVEHPKIVKLIGYCYDKPVMTDPHQRFAFADIVEKFICLEYIPNGSIDNYIYGEPSALDWPVRFRIIEGICEGLQVLQDHTRPIIHGDLNPANILLDNNMEPKISGFDLSVLFGEYQTHTRIANSKSAMEYMAPEYLQRGQLSIQSDIYSLGLIIIEIATGKKNCYDDELYTTDFIEDVRMNWMNMSYIASKYVSLGTEGHRQVKTCIEIGLSCTMKKRNERPTSSDIVQKLHESGTWSSSVFGKDKIDASSRPVFDKFGNGGSFLRPSNEATKPPPDVKDQEREIAALGRVLIGASAEPVMLSYAVCRNITEDFSKVIGLGGFGVVYMGVVQKWNMAVKKLSKIDAFSEQQFQEELKCLSRVKHENIVRFLGYCSDTQQQVLRFNGENVVADLRQRLLCFEYVPNKSLHEYLKDESYGRGWNTRYQMIKGICEGLHYLHKKERIVHLDLKPDNILLDDNMVPKITDFGLSIRFGGEQTRMVIETAFGSLGYMAPEYQFKGLVSFKADIFSLGIIIIKLLRGHNDLPEIEDWHEPLLHIDCSQMKRCIGIAQMCVDKEPNKRPGIDHIIDKLNEKESI